MKKIIFFLFIGITAFSVRAFAQDTMTICDCFRAQDTSFMQPVPFTLGADTGVHPPYYYCDLNTSQRLKLPFNFCFYGKNYDSVYIGNKGNITFGRKPIHTFTTGNFPAGADSEMIAPFWCAIDNFPFGPLPVGIGEVFYKISPKRLIVIWSQVKDYRFDADFYDSFRLTITDGTDPSIPGGNNVSFCYGVMQWACADSSGGSMGFGGVPATVGINKGDGTGFAQISRFSLPSSSFYGIDSNYNGTYWLDNKQFIFNTCVTGENIPPAILNPQYCDTVNLCAWDTAEYTLNFLCAIHGQTATFNATCPTLAPVTVSSVRAANGIYAVTVKAATNSLHTGYNTVTVTATDNSIPAQSISYPIVFNVGVCTGVNEVPKADMGFNIYPNSNHGQFTIELTDALSNGTCTAKIYDMLGQEVYAENFNGGKTEINMASQPKGIYFVRLLKGSLSIGTKKISIE